MELNLFLSQERKSSPKRKFSWQISRGHLVVIHADLPGQSFSHGPRKSGKKQHVGGTSADMHDPKARMSVTLNGFQRSSVRKTMG